MPAAKAVRANPCQRRDEIVRVLGDDPFFRDSGCTPNELANLLPRQLEPIRRAEHLLVASPTSGPALFWISRGFVGLHSPGESQRLMRVVGSTSRIVGTSGVLCGQPHSATALAFSRDVEVVPLVAEALLELSQRYHVLVRQALHRMHQTAQLLSQRIGESEPDAAHAVPLWFALKGMANYQQRGSGPFLGLNKHLGMVRAGGWGGTYQAIQDELEGQGLIKRVSGGCFVVPRAGALGRLRLAAGDALDRIWRQPDQV